MILRKAVTKLTGFILTAFFLHGCQSVFPPPLQPQAGGVYHRVQPGQTLYQIAWTYHIDVQTLLRINKIRDATNIPVGVRLWIPGVPRVRHAPSTGKPSAKKSRRIKPKNKPPIKNFLRWPVKGTLTSSFGKRGLKRHEGIDIGASKGAPIYAAADGMVVFSDWGPTGYGLMIIIKHKNHLTTVYAHNSKNWVRKNTQVKQGRKIASVGSTGRSTGPHLHFEVREDVRPRNPLKYLPAKR